MRMRKILKIFNRGKLRNYFVIVLSPYSNTVVSNSIKISRNFKLLYIRNGFQIRIPRPKYACAENFKYIRQRERPLFLKHVHGQKLLNFKLTKYGLVFMKKFYSKNNLWLKKWPFSLPYVLEIFITCIFSDEEFESEIRF